MCPESGCRSAGSGTYMNTWLALFAFESRKSRDICSLLKTIAGKAYSLSQRCWWRLSNGSSLSSSKKDIPVSSSVATLALNEFSAMLPPYSGVCRDEELIVGSIFRNAVDKLSNSSKRSKISKPLSSETFVSRGSHLGLHCLFSQRESLKNRSEWVSKHVWACSAAFLSL